MNRSERRCRVLQKLQQRKQLSNCLGLQGGLVYERHREKICHSVGYMRKGHVSHFIAVRPSRKTRSRNRYGRVINYSHRDAMRISMMEDQLEALESSLM